MNITFTKNYISFCNDISNNIFHDISLLQKRKRKYNINNIFNLMVESSFCDNHESNFKNSYSSNKYLSNSTLSYWRSKIYNIPFDNYNYSYVYSHI